jgi:hypothetical protein
MMSHHRQALLMIAAALLAIINTPALAQTEPCYELVGKASDYVFTSGGVSAITGRPTWYVTRAPGSTVPLPPTNRIADKCFFFRHEPWDMVAGKPVLRSDGSPASSDRFNEGWNAAISAVVVPARK